MFFKRLSLQGFKSFADPITIEFDRGITCVVGPNGSGKSNLSDALRWVLGEQSPKMLRGGKMDEVIFDGTDERKSKGMAEVTLVIDNSDGSLKIDFNEVSITRRMYRSGESEYLINESQCRLKDIRELIMDTGIGVDGYSLIGQGKISEIISGKPESRREIFEEAAGIVKYRTKKAETEKKLESTKTNLERVNDIISELEGRIEPLRVESEKAQEYLKLTEKYKETEINVTLKNIEEAEKQSTIYQNDITGADAGIFEKEKERDVIENGIRQKKLSIEELDKADFEERDKIMTYNSEMNELENKVMLDEEKIASLTQNISRLNAEKIALTEQLNAENADKRELESKYQVLNQRCTTAENELNEIAGHLNDETARFREKSVRFSGDRDKLYELSMQASAKTAEIAGLKSMYSSLSLRKQSVIEQYSDIEEDSAAETAYKSALKHREDCLQLQNNIHIRLGSQKKNLEQTQERQIKAEAGFDAAKLKLSEELTKRTMLQQLEDSYEGYNYAVRFIMKESGLKNIYGTVGDIIDVPRGYEVAVETALGARVQNIVCKDDSSADDAIKVLKRRRAGRLTFLPAENLKVSQRRSEEGLSEEDGFVGIAADCVNFETQYRNVVEYLLGGIAVVKNLEDALHISKKYSGFRYVTLEGEFINPAGAITGGAYKNNNTSGILDRKNRLNEVERRVFELERDKAETENECRRAAEDSEAVKLQILDSEEELRKMELEILRVNNEISALELKITQYNDKVGKSRRELERLNAEIEENEKLTSEAEREKKQTDAMVEALKKSAEAIAEENELAQKSIDLLAEKLTAAKLASETVKGEITNIVNLHDRVEKRIAELEKELGNREVSSKNESAELENIHFQISQTQQNIELKKKSHIVQNDRIRQIREEKLRLSKEVERDLVKKEETDRILYSLRTTKHELGVKLENVNSRIDGWKNKFWDEFEISYLEAVEYRKVIFDLNDGIKESRRLKNALKNLGSINVSSIEEYKMVTERYAFLTAQRKDLDEAISTLRRLIDETDQRIKTSFKSSFRAISMNFANIFTELFGGGKAEIRIDENADPLTANIDIIVQPPGKKLQNMNLLSGGEKTMTAIALMFAVLKAKPTPFCILDEVEAALDEANIERFAEYLQHFENIQFVLVTHQKVTMQHANVLYGVTMPEKGISKILSLKLDDAEKIGELS